MPARQCVPLLVLALLTLHSGNINALQTLELENLKDGGEDSLYLEEDLITVCSPPPSSGGCEYICNITSLVVAWLNTSAYDSACTTQNLTWNFIGEPEAIIRLRLLDKSILHEDESLVVLENDQVLQTLTAPGEAWVTSDLSNMTIQFNRAKSPSSIFMEITAYNRTKSSYTLTSLEDTLMVPEQTNRTGEADYALNTEVLWMLDINAYQINFTVQHLDLDSAAGDLLIIGYGNGPWDTVPPGTLLSGHFSTKKYHIEGGEAFVYFFSRNHAKPSRPFQVHYVAEEIIGTTSTVATTTDKNHPPTPKQRSFDLAIYITGSDPRLFMNASTNATKLLQKQLALYTDIYRHKRDIDVWRSVHPDDIQFSSWRTCMAASGWVVPDPGCFSVSWYVEMLTKSGDWAFYTEDLRNVIQLYHTDMSQHLGYTVSLTLEEVNQSIFWSITIVIVPLALLIFAFMLYNRTRSARVEENVDDHDADIDERCVADDVIAGREVLPFYKEVPDDVIEEKDSHLRRVFNMDEYEDYDAEVNRRQRSRALRARLTAHAPLKSALKNSKPTPPAVVNAAYQPDLSGEEDEVLRPPTAAPASPSEHQKKSSDLLDELEELDRKERQIPGLELPRVTEIVRDEPHRADSVLFSVQQDGTGMMVDNALPGEKIVQLEADARQKHGNTSVKGHPGRTDSCADRTTPSIRRRESGDMSPRTAASPRLGGQDEDDRLGGLTDHDGRKNSGITLRRIMSSGDEEC